MSLVYITHHDENIGDIEKQRATERHYKLPKYISIHRKNIKDAPLDSAPELGKKVILPTYRFSHKTMGYAETPLVCPDKFLKKNGGVKWQRFTDHVCPPTKGLSPIPQRAKTSKDETRKEHFIQKNVKRIKTVMSSKRQPKYVDNPTGTTFNLDGTGLEPEYVLSAKFGKPPVYLNVFKKNLKTSACDQLDKKENHWAMSMLSESERNALLTGLHSKHQEIEKTYQLLPIFTDTYAKRIRKGRLELELKRLEQDIQLLESNSRIIICDE